MPNLYASGVQGAWDYLAIDLLGASLDSLHRRSGKETMDLRSVCSIAIQVVSHAVWIFLPLPEPNLRLSGYNLCTNEGSCIGTSSLETA